MAQRKVVLTSDVVSMSNNFVASDTTQIDSPRKARPRSRSLSSPQNNSDRIPAIDPDRDFSSQDTANRSPRKQNPRRNQEINQKIISRRDRSISPSISHSSNPAISLQNPSTFSNISNIKAIDDSLVVDFSLEKFQELKFSIGKKIKLFFEYTFPFFTQSMVAPICQILFNTFFDIKISGLNNLKNVKGPILFISNHFSVYDSFIFDLFVHPFSHILPYRFMGTTKFSNPTMRVLKWTGIPHLTFLLFGVFKIIQGQGADKGLREAYNIIKNRGTVVMYPEGQIWNGIVYKNDGTKVRSDEPIGPFRWGAAKLAKNTGVQVIPVSMRLEKNAGNDGIVTKKMRKPLIINIGEAYHVDHIKEPEVIADEMRRKVVELFERV